ncbi:MAG TPA: fibrinogen-like YCDxxxxGGGW domain-containing protein [Polyangiales bacterium]|nr:fibrinogen-like YCDxxxxGGGW domain-containing protein [Polyangiales bacterium]
MMRFTPALVSMALVGFACTSVETARNAARCGDAGRCGDGGRTDAAALSDASRAGDSGDRADDASARPDGGEPADAGADGAVGGAGGAGDDAAASGGAGDGGAGGTGGSTTACDDASPCDRARNCEQHACVAPTVSCNAHKNSYPSAPDGVFWISPTGTPMRAYCDMSERVELCTEIESDHRGVTRDPTKLAYSLRSVLIVSEGLCSIWAVRDTAEQLPLTQLHKSDTQPLDTCQALGFAADGTLGVCAYGSYAGFSKCGFPIADAFMVYGNLCGGCVEHDGTYDAYVRQGPVLQGDVISSFDGTTKTTCRVR